MTVFRRPFALVSCPGFVCFVAAIVAAGLLPGLDVVGAAEMSARLSGPDRSSIDVSQLGLTQGGVGLSGLPNSSSAVSVRTGDIAVESGTVLEPGVLSYEVSLEPRWAEVRTALLATTELSVGTGGTLIDTAAAGVLLELADQPEMVILDTFGRPASFLVRSRSSVGWTDWIAVESDGDEQPDVQPGAGRSENTVDFVAGNLLVLGGASVGAIGPVWVGDGVDAVEIVDLTGSQSRLRIETIASLAAESEVEQLAQDGLAGSPLSLAQTSLANAAAEAPAILPRSAWASEGWAYTNDGCSDGPSYSDNVRTVVIHHTVTTNSYSQAQVDDLLRGIYRTHVKVNGWCDIGYNFVVDRFGTIWEGRSGGVDQPVIGGHARGFNTWSAGVALLGQHQAGASPTVGSPTSASLQAIAVLASWKLGLHGIDPNGTTWMKSRTKATTGLRYPDGTWVEVPTILGHRDLGSTSCPGSRTYSNLGVVRSASVRDLVVPFLAPSRVNEVSGPAFLTVGVEGRISPGGAANFPLSPPVSSPDIVAIAAVNGVGYTVDRTGMLRAFGGLSAPSSSVTEGVSAVDVVLVADGQAGYVLDLDGGLHPFKGASPISTSSLGGDAVAVVMAGQAAGYVLGSDGGLHAFGSAPTRSLHRVVDAVGVGLRPGGSSGWVLDRSGLLHPFGGAPDWQRSGAVFNGVARSVVVDPNGNGGWVLDSEGRLDVFGEERVAAPLSTTVGVGTAVDVALWWELPAGLVDEDRARYVSALVQLFLDRESELVELDRLGWKVDFYGAIALADQLANSDEWAGEIVDQNYLGVLGRLPDVEGREYWVGRLRSGMRTQDLGSAFYSSPEYYAAAGSDEAYVRRLYVALLHREADEIGLAHWVGLLQSGGATPVDIAAGFYRSVESRNDRVTRLYERVLLRGPDAAGLAFWSDRLFFDDDIALARDLAVSEEFYERTTK